MAPLWPLLPCGADETPLSFASRLARLHGRSIRPFCSDLGLRLTDLVAGREAAVLRLADLGGVPRRQLLDNTIVRSGLRSHVWRGQWMGNNGLNLLKPRVCPRCLVDDMRRASDGSGPGPHWRAVWLVRHVRTCTHHRVAMVELPSSYATLHDFAARVDAFLPELAAPEFRERARDPSRFERYLLGRLGAHPGPERPWLDGLAFAATADLCEVVGSIVSFGRKVANRLLDDNAWHTAGAIGFDVVSDGPPAIREMLSAWQGRTGGLHPSWLGDGKALGRFCFFLNPANQRQDLDLVRDLVADHLMRTVPMAAGKSILGRVVRERFVHSIHSASQEYGIPAPIVRKVLRDAGVIDASSGGRHSRTVAFEAARAGSLLAAATRLLSGRKVAEYLDASKQQAGMLVRSGLIQATVGKPHTAGFQVRKFSMSALDDFLDRLARGAVAMGGPEPGARGIPHAASLAGCPPLDVVRLILDGRLGWVGRRTDLRGYAAIQVRVSELRNLLGNAGTEPMTARAVGAAIGLREDRVGLLIRAGLISGQAATGAPGRKLRNLVSPEDVARFRATYVTGRQLGREWGMEARFCRVRLAGSGVFPVFSSGSGKALVVYRRADLPEI